MTEKELAAIRQRDAAWQDYRQSPDSVSPSADRRALLQELDRVRDLWEQCRSNCFDPTIRARRPPA